MPPSNSTRRAALAAAAVVGGVMVAMIVEIALARRGVLLVSAWQNIHRDGGTPLRAAIAWWAIAGGAFPAGFVLAFVLSRWSWLYFRSLRFVAAAALTLVLAWIGDLAPPAAAGAAGLQALTSLAALAAAMLMAGFGAFFAVRP
jgi:hypothetical protein